MMNIELELRKNAAGGEKKKLILVADKNPSLSELLAGHLTEAGCFDCTYIKKDFNVCAEIVACCPDIVILDPFHLALSAEYDILDFGRNVREINPKVRMLAYSFKVSTALIRGALDAGFRGCVSKNSSLRHLEIALAAVMDGGIYFDKEFGAQLRPLLAETTEDDVLSEREKDVIIRFARGFSAKQIAHDLKISNKTVDTYKARATQKLGLSDRAKLVDYVIEQGWMN